MDVKGTAVISTPIFVKSRFENRFGEWLDSLSSEARTLMSGKVLATEWYPIDKALLEPTAKICDLFYDGKDIGAWQAGRFSCDYALRGVYKIFVMVASPDYIIKRASRIFSNYYRPSEMKVVDKSANKTILHIVKFPEPNRFIELRIGGWAERALEMCGGKDIRVTMPKSLVKGDQVTEYSITWR
jgi:hypothetical protein